MRPPTNAEQYENFYAAAQINAEHLAMLQDTAAYLKNNQMAHYFSVAQATGLPWQLIAALHWRESSGNFKTYLQNGDPLWNSDGNAIPTTHVPRGIGPFNPQTWGNGAIKAISDFYGYAPNAKWSLGDQLIFAEKYNGFAYHNRMEMSPYLWSFTSLYTKGKFSADGKYDPNLVDAQAGVVAILKALEVAA